MINEKHEVVNARYTSYLFRIEVSNGIIFHLRDRYSSILTFQSAVRKDIPIKTNIPEFPRKKFVGNLDPNFIRIRATNLTQFLNMFLALPMVKKNDKVPRYFKDRAHGPNSLENVKILLAG